MMRRGRGLFVATGAVMLMTGMALGIACGTPYGEAASTPPDGGSNGADVNTGTGQPTDPCEHTSGAIPKPAADDDPVTELPPFVAAIEKFQLGGTGLGYDLDGVCSCDARPETAHGGGASCTRKQAVCDDDGGVDNAFATIINGFSGFGDIQTLTGADARIQDGRQTVLIFVRRYNGLANDLDVEIGMLPSDGLRIPDGCAGATETSDGNYGPKWCGSDKWSYIPKGALSDGTPIAISDGYVSNYQFYVALPGTTHVGLGEVELDLGTSVLTGKFVPLGDDLQPRPPGKPTTDNQKRFFRIENGQLAGRLAAASLLGVLGALKTPGGGDGGPADHVCNSPLFLQARKEVCDALDVARTPSLDFQNLPCDAISASIGFTAMPALREGTYATTRGANDCLPTSENKPEVPSEYAPTYECPSETP